MELILSSAVLFTMTTILLIIWVYIIQQKENIKCPEPKTCIIDNIGIPGVRIMPELDLQFSNTNLPSYVYQDVFTGPNVWLGGYNAAMNAGRTVIKRKNT